MEIKSYTDLTPVKPVYDTDDDVRKFYVEYLSSTKEYKRASAYFSTGFYDYISKGLEKLISSGGRMQLILSTDVDESVLSEIRKGLEVKKDKPEFISSLLEKSVFRFSDVETDLSLVAFLIAIDRLDIRFAFMREGEGIFHDKFAILKDYYGNEMILSGSNNETAASVMKNHESFETTINWDEPGKNELKKIEVRKAMFERYWNDEAPSIVVLPMTEVMKESLIERISTPEAVGKYPAFIRIGFDDYGNLKIQTNIGLEKLFSKYKFDNYIQPFISTCSSTSISLRKLDMIEDVAFICNIVEDLSNDLKARFVETEGLKAFLDKNHLDMKKLAAEGILIKSGDLAGDLDFVEFCSTVQGCVKRPLKEAQLVAAYHVAKLRRSMNFSVPGSGKTSAVLGAYEYLNSLDKNNIDHIDRLLVIGPLNCFKSWKDEYAVVSKSYEKYDPTQILDIRDVSLSGEKCTLIRYDFPKAKLVLVNYDSVVSLCDVLSEFVDSRTMVVFDEIHRIKNYESEKFPSCRKIISGSRFRVALTGTPLPNGYRDLLCMFTLLYDEYAQTYFNMYVDDLAAADKAFDENGLESERLNAKIFPFFIRTNKHELNVPPAEPDNVIKVRTTKEEDDLYSSVLNESSDDYLGASIRLTEIGCIPKRLLYDEAEKTSEYLSGDFESFCDDDDVDMEVTSKLAAFLETIDKQKGKSVVWCLFTDTIRKVHRLLLQRGYKSALIYGNTPLEERNSIIDAFNKTDKIDVIVTNPNTLAESVSLHKACHNAYYLELNYNLAHYLQSRDRIHRLGLAPEIKTNYFIFINCYFGNEDSSIDNEIYRRLQKKEKRMIEAIDHGSLLYRYESSVGEYEDIIQHIRKAEKRG